MKLNSHRLITAGYEPLALPAGHCSPDVLADAIIHGRRFNLNTIHEGDVAWLAPLSDEGVKNLVGLVYYASLMPEEGRYSQFKVVCRRAETPTFVVSRFEPTPLSVDFLRGLAPACTRTGCALLVSEREGILQCEGEVTVDGLGYGTVLGMPGVVSVGSSPTLSVEVFGPGHIRVGESGAPSYEIRAGKVRHLSPYDVPGVTKVLLDAVIGRVKREVLPLSGLHFAPALTDARPFLLILSRMLRVAVDAKHGGTFIFLPAATSETSTFGLNLRFRTTDLDLGGDLVNQWLSYGDVSKNRATEGFEQALATAEHHRSRALSDCEAVGNFSAVDGCVVLTRELKVLGFGAKIVVSAKDAEGSARRFKHIASNTIYSDADFMAGIGGTRHQSVARLCQAHEGVVAYTVSQDGELKLFYSDAEFAYAFGPLHLPTILDKLHVW